MAVLCGCLPYPEPVLSISALGAYGILRRVWLIGWWSSVLTKCFTISTLPYSSSCNENTSWCWSIIVQINAHHAQSIHHLASVWVPLHIPSSFSEFDWLADTVWTVEYSFSSSPCSVIEHSNMQPTITSLGSSWHSAVGFSTRKWMNLVHCTLQSHYGAQGLWTVITTSAPGSKNNVVAAHLCNVLQ